MAGKEIFQKELELEQLLDLARTIVIEAHQDQVDKQGRPYIEHVMNVSRQGKTLEEKIVGLLHDVVEDTKVTLDDLIDYSFPEEIVAAIDCMTKREGESQEEYLTRVKSNALAATVKLNDIADNLRKTEAMPDGEAKRKFYEKYLLAKAFLFG